MSTLLAGLLICLIVGMAAFVLWPRRASTEARAFALAATVTAVILAAANFLNRRRK